MLAPAQNKPWTENHAGASSCTQLWDPYHVETISTANSHSYTELLWLSLSLKTLKTFTCSAFNWHLWHLCISQISPSVNISVYFSACSIVWYPTNLSLRCNREGERNLVSTGYQDQRMLRWCHGVILADNHSTPLSPTPSEWGWESKLKVVN